MKTATMKLADIIPAEYNPRVPLQKGDTEYEALARSIERFGLVEPLIVNERNNILIGGHQRLKVLLDSGETETEVVLVDLDDTNEKTLNVALNKIEGDWDFQKLEKMLKDMEPEEYQFTGFSEDEIENIIGISEENENNVEQLIEETGGGGEDSEIVEEVEKPFEIYLSFGTKDEAENWLRQHHYEEEFTTGSRNVTIHMEG